MPSLTRFDWIIAVVILAVLGALVGLGLSNRSHAASASAHAPAATAPAPSSAPGAGAPTTGPPATSVTTTAPPVTTTAPTTPVPPLAGTVTAVGDSVMLDIQPYLQADLPGVQVDGLVSRQFDTGISVVQADRAAGTLGSILVVELGTNGTVTSTEVDQMMQAAAGVKRVVFVNVDVPRSW
jgi:hypothetical protein